MQEREARLLLGFPPNSRPTIPQVKAAYKKKVWDSHPDLFPAHEKPRAESHFKLISEAYSSLHSNSGEGIRSIRIELRSNISSAMYTRVVRTGVPKVHGARSHALIPVPFLLIIFGTVALGGLNASRAYRKNREAYPSSNNPFLP